MRGVLCWVGVEDSEVGGRFGEGGGVHDVELDLAAQLHLHLALDLDEPLLVSALGCIIP